MKWPIVICYWLLAGCVYAPMPELPAFPPIEHIETIQKTEAEKGNLKVTEEKIKHPQPRDSPPSQNTAEPQCPSLPMPEPIPKTLYIEIGEGTAKADENGERLLTNYKELRKEIKKKWHAKPP
jgi:hypothetical protein